MNRGWLVKQHGGLTAWYLNGQFICWQTEPTQYDQYRLLKKIYPLYQGWITEPNVTAPTG